ncbi:hypothetical protein [Runella limosa]|uniref:hypothetical protein n=1 Tax=Runella limosa TaxID=370978 RepID=UPI00048B3297|nr:hypothetical protein [Runella limosa]
MTSSLLFIQFVAFYLWQITAAKRQPVGDVWAYALEHKSQTRLIGVSLLLASSVGFIFQWGLASGLFGFFVGLMTVGCLSVIIEPFSYLRLREVMAIYVCCTLLEIIL